MSHTEQGEEHSTDNATSAPQASPKRRRVRMHLAISLVATVGATLVLFGVSRVLASFSDYNWFHAGCGILALVGFVGTIGAAAWSGITLLLRRLGRGGTARPLLIMSLAVFGLVPFVVGIVTDQPPSLRPTDSPTWAGYGTTRNGITQASATWVQPRVYPLGSRPNDVAFWVGLTYPESREVEQIGTAGDCQRHTPATYDAWYELYPAPLVTTTVAIRPGDRITATVVRLGENRFRLTLSNATTGGRFSTTQVADGVGNTKGTIIVEEPTFSGVDLAGFDPAHFTKCAFNGQSIGGFRLSSFDIASDAGVMETTTSNVEADGFTVTRR